MADNVESRIDLNIDVSNALASIKTLQAQISAFHQSIRNSGNAVNQAVSDNLTKNLLNSINATQKFSASLTTVNDSAQSFTNALERNKLSMGEYFRFAGGASKNFGRLFKNEFNTIEKVARERVKTLQTQYIRMGRDANGALEAIKVRPLRLDMEQLGTQVAMTAQKQQLFNQLIKQGSTNLLNFGKNTQWAGRQLMVGFTIPLSIMGGMAIKEFEKIEKQAIRFKRVYGDAFSTDAETDAALANIRKLATEFTKYGVEVEKTLELAADAAQMGLKGADLNAQVAEATRLAVLGEVEQQEALKATIAVTNTFGIAAEDLAEKINFLNAVENETLTAISDLTIAIPKAGPVVKQLGGSVEDLAFFLTAMKEGGINASEGANALKSALSKVINPTEKASEMLRGYGINLNSIVEGNAGDIKTTILELGAAFDRLDPLSRSRAIEQLFGTFQFARISTLFNNISKEGGQAAKVLELTKASSAQLAILSERELKRVEDSPIFKFEKAIERLQESLAPLGVEFIKIITPLIEFGTKILKSFNQMDEGAKAFVTNIVTVLGLIAPVAIMTFGLIANGIANFIKGVSFVGSLLGKVAGAGTGLNQMTQYMTQEQLEATAAASALGQAHSMLTTAFNVEKVALDGLVGSYNNAITAINRYNVASQSRSRPGETPTTRAYARGVLSVPGPKGAGDVIPAMLSPGEAVIPAEEAQKYRGFISQMISGNIPGFSKGVMLGMPRSGKAVAKDRENAQAIFQNFKRSKYANVPPTEYGHQLAKTTGHSFPLFGVGGVYLAPSGKKVFVKPVLDETAAMAEMRGTQIARQAHGLKAPQQRVVVMRDPYDIKRQRKFLALESDLDATFVNNDPKSVFNEEQYFRQLVASLVRVDKDLAASNMFGDVVADVGPAGVFSRASGARDYTTDLPSMEQQAMVNLLGVKGGAKRAFAESTVGLMAGLSPQQYQQKMITEIQRVLPALRQTIAGFGLTDQREIDAYTGMVRRLEQGLTVDWSKFHAIHSGVKVTAPKPRQTDTQIRGYADGVVSVPGPKGKGDVIPAMLSPGEAVIPAKKAKKYNALIRAMIAGKIPGFDGGTIDATQKLLDYDPGRGRRTANKSVGIIDEAGGDGLGLANQLTDAGVSIKNAMKIMSEAADKAASSLDEFKSYVDIVTSEIEQAPKKRDGAVKSSENLVADIREKSGFDPGNKGDVLTHVSGGAKVPAQNLLDRAESGQLNLYSKEKDLETLRTKAAAGESLDVKSGLGMVLPAEFQKVNVDLDKAGASIEDFSQAVQSNGIEKWNDSIKFGGGNVEELSAQTQILENEFQRLVAAVPAGTKVFDTAAQAQASDGNATSLEQLYGQARTNVKGQAPDLVNVLDTAAATPTEIRGLDSGASPGRSKRRAMGAPIPELADAAVSGGIADSDIVTHVNETANSTAQGLLTAIDKGLGISSPSREMYERGKNIVQGMVNGVQEELDRALGKAPGTTSTPTPPPNIPGFEPPAVPNVVNPDIAKGQSLGKKLVSKTEKFLENQIMGDGFLSKTEIGKNLKSAIQVNNGDLDDQLRHIEGETQLERSKRELLVQQRNVQAVNAGQYAEVGRLLDEEKLNLDEEQINIAQQKQNLDQEEIVTKTRRQSRAEERAGEAKAKRDLKQKKAQDRQSRAGKALGVLGTATMVAGMASGVEGVVGEIAQKAMPFLAGMSAVAPILLALPLPLAALALAVGGIAFGLYKMNEATEKSREAGRKLGDALTLSTDKLIKFSEATGKVSATEERRRADVDQITGTTAGQRDFGMTFLESDAGKGLLDQINTLASSGLNAEQSAEAIGRQLAMLVLQGVLTGSEANSIVAAIGLEIDDQGFSADISGELISLIGPNGEDITKDPLQVALEIQAAGANQFEDLTGLVDDIINTDYSTADFVEQFGTDEVKAKYEELSDGVIAEIDKIEDRTERMSSTDFLTKAVAYAENTWADFTDSVEDFIFNPFGADADKDDFNIAKDFLKENAPALTDFTALQSATIQVGIGQLQEGQQVLDAFEKQMTIKEQQLEADIAQEESAEKKRKLEGELILLQRQRSSGLEELNSRNEDTLNDLIKMRDMYTDSGAWSEAIKATTLTRFAEDDPMRVLAESTLNQLAKVEDQEIRSTLELGLAGGELAISTVQGLLEIGEDGEITVNATFKLAVDRKGFAEVNQIQTMLNKLNLDSEDEEVIMGSITGIDDPEQYEQFKQALAELSQFEGEYNFEFDFESGEDALGILSQVANAMDNLEDKPDKLTFEMLTDANTTGQYDEILANWNDLVGMDQVMTKTMIFEFLTAFNGGGQSLVDWFLQKKGLTGAPRDVIKEQFAKQGGVEAAAVTELIAAGKNTITTPRVGEDGEEGGDKADPFANILSQLKLLRNAAINAGGGLTELLRILGDSAKEMRTFRGVSQKLLAEGFSREFIDSVMSMDEETRKTFIGIENGVITVTKEGRALNRAFAEASLGEYQNTLAETAIGINAQVTAMTKLTAAGVPLADASEMVQDKNLAIQIAAKASTEEIWALKKAFDAVTEAEKNFANSTPEGRRKQIESIVSEANSFFAAQEAMYNQRYEAALKAYEDANDITEAQRDLADKEFALDDLQFALNSIADQESKINEEYDKRQEAIENIFKANKAIIDQDKERLDIAGALASGDLAAAAKAMRAQTVANLERNKEQQLENLQRSRELEISQVRDDSGKSRLELEEAILGIEKQIADIQEKKLEPYQREIDLLGRIRDDAIADVSKTGFLGQTKDAWAAIANEVDRARFNVDGYQKALKDQLTGIPGITFNPDGTVSVDSDQLNAEEVSPEPFATPVTEDTLPVPQESETTLEPSIAKANPNQAEIDELNRLRKISRKNFQESKDEEYKKRLFEMNVRRGERIKELGGVPMAMGGIVKYLRMGGMLPYKSEGGSIFKSMGTDTVPAMLTPGEFVVRRRAVSNFGVDKLNAINTGTYSGESVYNYSVNVNVKSDANPDEIARSVMTQIKRIDSQRIRSNNY